MKTRNGLMSLSKLYVAAIAALSLMGVTNTQAATPNSQIATANPPAATTLSNQILIHNQDINTGIIEVDAVTAAQNGWVVIYNNPNFTSGAIVGYAPVYKGTNMGVKVTVDTSKLANVPALWAVLHVDGGFQGVFEWGYRGQAFNDPPVFRNGYVTAAFGTKATP